MQWNQTPCAFLRQDLRAVQNQEQTLELRLPEGMPDIGRVLCAWGQVVLRSKQWRSDSIQLSGGVSAWVLYAPEDGSEPRSVECWLPLQAKWNLPETRREGTIRACGVLRSLDARLLSARKLMVRASAALLAEALEPDQAEIYTPAQMPEDVQLLEKTYPVTLPREAGEKLLLMDEEAVLPEAPEKLLAWELSPVLTEQSVIGGRAVFKGTGRLHLVYLDGSGRVKGCYVEVPFAQFAELDADYDKEATVSAMLAVSSLEPEISGERVHVKAGLICQYVVYDCCMLKICQDVYSPFRTAEPELREAALPMLLDRRSSSLELRSDPQQPLAQTVDVAFYPEQPIDYREGDDMILELPGVFQVLGYDEQGQLMAYTENALGRIQLPAGSGCALWAERCELLQNPVFGPGELTAQVQLELLTAAQQPLSMVAGVEMGTEITPDPARPSLILRRCGEQSLWELAKGCGSTVDAIRKANKLTADPPPEQMLLIPVC